MNKYNTVKNSVSLFKGNFFNYKTPYIQIIFLPIYCHFNRVKNLFIIFAKTLEELSSLFSLSSFCLLLPIL